MDAQAFSTYVFFYRLHMCKHVCSYSQKNIQRISGCTAICSSVRPLSMRVMRREAAVQESKYKKVSEMHSDL